MLTFPSLLMTGGIEQAMLVINAAGCFFQTDNPTCFSSVVKNVSLGLPLVVKNVSLGLPLWGRWHGEAVTDEVMGSFASLRSLRMTLLWRVDVGIDPYAGWDGTSVAGRCGHRPATIN